MTARAWSILAFGTPWLVLALLVIGLFGCEGARD